MAFTFGFYNSLNGDRKYNAEQISAIFDGLISNGVYDTIGQLFAVKPGTGMQVTVGTGRAWFDHTWNDNDSVLPLFVDAADITLARYDTVVLEVNAGINVRTNTIKIVKGTAGTNPVKPTLTNSGSIHQHALAHIRIPGGATSITASMIQNVVGTSECPFVTGIIQTAQIDALFQQWEGEFDEWFENVQATLTDNVVTNLQLQIDQRVKIADKATTAEAQAGTNDTKWLTPAKLKAFMDSKQYAVGDIVESTRDLESETNGVFVRCDGRSYSKSAKPDLFNKIGYTYGMPVKRISNVSVSRNPTKYFEKDSYVYLLGHTVNNTTNNFLGYGYYNTSTGSISTLGYINSSSIGIHGFISFNNYVYFYISYPSGKNYVLEIRSIKGSTVNLVYTMTTSAAPSFFGTTIYANTLYILFYINQYYYMLKISTNNQAVEFHTSAANTNKVVLFDKYAIRKNNDTSNVVADIDTMTTFSSTTNPVLNDPDILKISWVSNDKKTLIGVDNNRIFKFYNGFLNNYTKEEKIINPNLYYLSANSNGFIYANEVKTFLPISTYEYGNLFSDFGYIFYYTYGTNASVYNQTSNMCMLSTVGSDFYSNELTFHNYKDVLTNVYSSSIVGNERNIEANDRFSFLIQGYTAYTSGGGLTGYFVKYVVFDSSYFNIPNSYDLSFLTNSSYSQCRIFQDSRKLYIKVQ